MGGARQETRGAQVAIAGRYVLEGEVASGGMATVYYGRRLDEEPPGTTVAIKRVHPHLARDARFASMFIDEARLVSRIHHPNVIRTLDIIASDSECLLVMEYIHGVSLGRLVRLAEVGAEPPELGVVSAIVCGALDGLQASHDATNAAGAPLNLVHRDISPQNIMVGEDGIPRVLDFGVAKAAGSLHVTRDGEIKGKLAYMAPEQLGAQQLDRRTDVYAAGVVLWEALTLRPLFDGDSEAAIIASVLRQEIAPPSTLVPSVSKALDAVVLRALAHDPNDRYGSAQQMAIALEAAVPRASVAKVAAWVARLAGAELHERQRVVDKTAGAGRARSATQSAPVGVTEVFFTRGTVGDARPTEPASPAGEAGPFTRGVTRVEAGMASVTSKLPARVRSPVHRYRWWLAGAGALATACLGYCAFAPTPPPAAGISAAPTETTRSGR